MTQYFNKKIASLLIIIPTILGAMIAIIIMLNHPRTIKVGILHSLSGEMAATEQSAIHGTLSAIEEINAEGGILGRQLEPILADGASTPEQFAQAASDLIVNKQVAAIFGCWTSSSRKAVKPIVEKHNNLLFYPVQFEGLETSPNIIYTGLTANQQIIPAVSWATATFGPNLYLVGSDYIYSHATHEIIKQFAKINSTKIVGESYIPRGSNNVEKAIQEIQNLKPHAIINTINGTSNKYFFQKLHAANITAATIPTISTSLDERTINDFGVDYLAGNFLTCAYFESMSSEENKSFTSMMKRKYGATKKISDVTQTSYTNVYMWANAVRKAKTALDIKKIKKQITSNSFMSSQGAVLIDGESFYEWQTPLIGKILNDGECLIVWQSKDPLKPQPFPKFATKEYWEEFLIKKYNEWGQKWERTN